MAAQVYLVGGREVLVWPEAFSPEECRQLAGRVDWPAPSSRGYQAIVEDASLARELGLLCASRMDAAPALEWLGDVTLTVDRRRSWHLDPARGATHKLCLYLDDAGEHAGIAFTPFAGLLSVGGAVDGVSGAGACTAPGAQGTIVLFDITLVHRAEPQPIVLPEDVRSRRVLGLRATVVV